MALNRLITKAVAYPAAATIVSGRVRRPDSLGPFAVYSAFV